MVVVEERHSIPLNSTDGIYVRDTQTGKVRSVVGATTYMLKPREVLWEKDVAPEVEALLTSQNDRKRDRTQIIKYSVGHGTLVQVYDYKRKESRYVFGPNLVMLGPDEQFTVMHLSGSKPKKPYVVTTIDVRLGPDFMTDIIIVETSDHARLKLTLCYSWLFNITEETAYKVFAVKDFVGDACKAIASRVRNAVASKPFDEFHKHSSSIIRRAVFGVDKTTDETRTQFRFAANELVDQVQNQDLFLNTLAWLVGEEQQVSIRQSEASRGTLEMNALQFLLVALISLLFVPGASLVAAVVTWRRRRGR